MKDDIKNSKKELDKNTLSWFESGLDIQKILEPRLKTITLQLEEKKVELESLKRKFEEVTLQDMEKSKSQLKDFKNKINSLLTNEEVFQFRSSVSNSIKNIVSKLYVDTSMTIYPWEYDNLEQDFIEQLKNKRYTTKEKVEKLLETAHGQRLYVEYERTIRVIFKSGKKGWLKPSRDINIRFNKVDFS